jgi:hypothetical protein
MSKDAGRCACRRPQRHPLHLSVEIAHPLHLSVEIASSAGARRRLCNTCIILPGFTEGKKAGLQAPAEPASKTRRTNGDHCRR